jgi:hypothetical protein
MPLDFTDQFDFDDLITLEGDFLDFISPRTYLVAGFLGHGELTIASGPPKQGGKTAFWLRVARRVSQGLPVFGRPVSLPVSLPVVGAAGHEPGVIYIALENPADVRDRVEALWEADDQAACSCLHLMTAPISLLDQRVANYLANYVKRWNIVLIVVDTLARAMRGADESRGADVGTLFANLALIRACGCHVVLIHHSNKTGDSLFRGHSDLEAAPDTLIRHTQLKDGTRTATVVAARADAPGLTLRYRVEPFELHNPDRTTVIAEDVATSLSRRAAAGGRPRSLYANTAFEQLRLIAADGRPSLAAWRDAFYGAVPDLTGDNRRKQFTRAKAELLAEGKVMIADGSALLRG